jgi:hypothetical protein
MIFSFVFATVVVTAASVYVVDIIEDDEEPLVVVVVIVVDLCVLINDNVDTVKNYDMLFFSHELLNHSQQ